MSDIVGPNGAPIRVPMFKTKIDGAEVEIFSQWTMASQVQGQLSPTEAGLQTLIQQNQILLHAVVREIAAMRDRFEIQKSAITDLSVRLVKLEKSAEILAKGIVEASPKLHGDSPSESGPD